MNYPAYKKTNKTGLPWVPVVPAHWEIKRLRFLAEGIEQGWSPQCNNYPAEGDEWGVLKVGCVNGNAFNPQENKQLPAELEPRTEYQIQLGDILISRANTRELLGSAGIVDKLTTKLLLCDKLYRLRVNDTIDKRFLVNYLRSKAARAHYECEATGTSGSMQNIGQDTIATLSVPLPPLDEQYAIVAFLDEQTARLDALLARQQRLLRLLAEKRTALITQAVTKGLNANTPSRPSGVDWLGEVPAHWEVLTLRRLFSVSSGDMISRDVIIDKGYPVFGGNGFRGYTADWNTEANSLLIGRYGALCGNVKIATERIFATEHAFRVYSLMPFDISFMRFVIEAIDLNQFSARSAQPGLNSRLVRDNHCALPPLEEQKEISCYVEQHLTRLDNVAKSVRKVIKKLQEYRAALINAAVTGQIDVRAAVTAEVV